MRLPSVFVTMLMTDIEGFTALVQHLGQGYREIIDEVWSILRRGVIGAGGLEAEAPPASSSPCSNPPGAPSAQRSTWNVTFSHGRGSKALRGITKARSAVQVTTTGLPTRFPPLRKS